MHAPSLTLVNRYDKSMFQTQQEPESEHNVLKTLKMKTDMRKSGTWFSTSCGPNFLQNILFKIRIDGIISMDVFKLIIFC